MKDFKLTLNEEKELISSMGEDINEINMCLQIYQDLVRLDSTHEEDQLIKSILEQILSQEYGSLSAIPVPNYYKSKDEQQD